MVGRIEKTSPAGAARRCREVRDSGGTVGFVPTMGALHRGHLALVERSVRENDLAVVSVFVNPLQFDDPRDLAAYPRDFEGDAAALESVGCGVVFTGAFDEFFPDGPPATVEPGAAARGLEGAKRPGHFAGVATIVSRLFELVRPSRAYFGQKDFQQCLVVRDLAQRSTAGPQIELCPTEREPDGLALSSRNARLDAAQRERALWLSRSLARAHARWAAGERGPAILEAALLDDLADGPFDEVEYGAVRDPERWTAETPDFELRGARALVAARIGGVRLIDNLALDGALPRELRGVPVP